ncbi:transcriptional regulator [Streptomyces sp. SID4944]|nr:transcriptional regulator [Streptomyces sp. SID4944]
MDVIGGKWKVLILWALAERTYRFGELRRAVPGVTEKVLTAHLKELEDDGIVHREEYAEVPPRVEYSLTPRGVALNTALGPLGDWGREHVYPGAGARRAPGTEGWPETDPCDGRTSGEPCACQKPEDFRSLASLEGTPT